MTMNKHNLFELFIGGKYVATIWKFDKYWIGSHTNHGHKSFRKAYAATLKALDLKNKTKV